MRSSVNHCHLTDEKGQDRLLKVGTHVLGLKILNCYLVRRRLKTASGMCWKAKWVGKSYRVRGMR